MKQNNKKKFIIKLAVLLFWLGVWQVAFTVVDKDLLIASPVNVFLRLIELCKTTEFWQSAFYSLTRLSLGYACAMVFGSLLAVLCYKFTVVNELCKPILTLIKSTPVVSFIILALVWVKRDSIPILISFLMVIPIVWANVSKGIANTDKAQIEMAKVYHLSPWKKFKAIYFHSVMPYFICAATTSFGLCWKAGISAEVISMPLKSIGYNLYRSKINLETVDLFAWTIVVVALSLIFEKIIVYILGKFQKYNLEITSKF